MPSKHSVGTYQGNELKRNLSGNTVVSANVILKFNHGQREWYERWMEVIIMQIRGASRFYMKRFQEHAADSGEGLVASVKYESY